MNIKTTAATVEIYHDSSLVAVHPRKDATPDDDAPIVNPTHMPENHRTCGARIPTL
ncbi:MAG: hypothetical protein ACK5II_06955 [Paracoccus sp. (in: a-proteobacteria)]